MTRKTTSAHDKLERLEERIADARVAEREAEQAYRAAEAAVEDARDAVREAHDLGHDPAKPTRRLERAKRSAEQAALALEGVGQRVRRATVARDSFMSESATQLIEELEPDCQAVAERVESAIAAVVDADREWHEMSAQVARYLRAAQWSRSENAISEHEISPQVRSLKEGRRPTCQ